MFTHTHLCKLVHSSYLITKNGKEPNVLQQTRVHSYREEHLSNEKEQTIDLGSNREECRIMPSGEKKPI